MSDNPVLFLVLLTTFFQVLHCFEEIGMDITVVIGKLRRSKKPMSLYLRAASVLVGINFLAAFLILFNLRFGIFLAFVTAITSIVNTVVHLAGYIRHKSFWGTVGAGVFSGIPLGLCGAVLLVYLLKAV